MCSNRPHLCNACDATQIWTYLSGKHDTRFSRNSIYWPCERFSERAWRSLCYARLRSSPEPSDAATQAPRLLWFCAAAAASKTTHIYSVSLSRTTLSPQNLSRWRRTCLPNAWLLKISALKIQTADCRHLNRKIAKSHDADGSLKCIGRPPFWILIIKFLTAEFCVDRHTLQRYRSFSRFRWNVKIH